MTETPIDAIDSIFQDLRQSFSAGKTKPVAWRKHQIAQIYKMCDEQKGAFAAAAKADFHRPDAETLIMDCGSVRLSFFRTRRSVSIESLASQ